MNNNLNNYNNLTRNNNPYPYRILDGWISPFAKIETYWFVMYRLINSDKIEKTIQYGNIA